MAQDTNNLINQQIDSIKALKQEIKGLKDEMVTIPQGTAEWAKKAEDLRAAQKKLDDINKAAKGTYVDLNKVNKDSIINLKERIKQLNLERNAMDMNSKEYKNATKELKVLNDKLREAGTSAGDWRANVGNYANSLKQAFGQLGAAAGGLAAPIGAANTALTTLSANPIGAAITAIVAALGLLAKGISSSEENTNKFNQSLAPLKAVFEVLTRYIQEATSKILDWFNGIKANDKVMKGLEIALQAIVTAIKVAIDRLKNMYEGWVGAFRDMKEWADKLKDFAKPLIDQIDKVVNKITKALSPAIDWIIDKYNALAETNFGKMLGLTSIDRIKEIWNEAGDAVDDFVDDVEDATKTISALEKARAAFAKNERARNKANAKDNASIAILENEIALLREAMNETTDYAEKKKILLEIEGKTREQQELALQVAERQKASASEALNIARLESKETQNTAQANDKLAAAEVAVTNATANANSVASQYNNTLARIAKQNTMFTEAEKAEALKNAVIALNASLKEFDAAYTDASANNEKPDNLESNEATKENINQYYAEMQAFYDADLAAYRAMTDGKISALEEFIEKQKELGNDTSVQEAEISKLRAAYAKKEAEIDKQKIKNSKDQTKALKANYNQQLSAYSSLLDGMSSLMEENTIAYKATAVAKAIIDTYLAAQNALATLPPPASYVAAAASIATGLANVIAIVKTNPKGETNVPSPAEAPPIAQPNLVDSTPYSFTRTVQTADEEDLINQPQRVYVLESDITDAQNRAKTRVSDSTY